MDTGGNTMKIDYKKQEKALYQPKPIPNMITVVNKIFSVSKGKEKENTLFFQKLPIGISSKSHRRQSHTHS